MDILDFINCFALIVLGVLFLVLYCCEQLDTIHDLEQKLNSK